MSYYYNFLVFEFCAVDVGWSGDLTWIARWGTIVCGFKILFLSVATELQKWTSDEVAAKLSGDNLWKQEKWINKRYVDWWASVFGWCSVNRAMELSVFTLQGYVHGATSTTIHYGITKGVYKLARRTIREMVLDTVYEVPRSENDTVGIWRLAALALSVPPTGFHSRKSTTISGKNFVWFEWYSDWALKGIWLMLKRMAAGIDMVWESLFEFNHSVNCC